MNSCIKICPLSSGSNGNCIFVNTGDAKILVDCGISGKCVEHQLRSIGVEPSEIDAIIITHEHIDHISGAGVICRRYHLPIFATIGTWQAMIESLGKIDVELIRYIAADVPFKIKNSTVTPFKTSHDAAESVGLVFSDGKKAGAIVTDLGTVDRHIYDLLMDCSVLMIEANHDERMLVCGPYPKKLKDRILSDKGHLSNRLCAAFCAKLVREGKVRQIILGHLSCDNNTPELAFSAVASSLKANGINPGSDVALYVAKRNCAGEMLVDEE